MQKQLLFGLTVALVVLTGTVSARAAFATKSYKMQPDDLLVAHGANANSLGGVGGMFGHVAMATTANYVIEMPGKNYGYSLKRNAHVTPKKTFLPATRHQSPAAGSMFIGFLKPSNKRLNRRHYTLIRICTRKTIQITRSYQLVRSTSPVQSKLLF